MKTRWWMTLCAAALLALIFGAAVARGRMTRKTRRARIAARARSSIANSRRINANTRMTYYGQNQNHEVFRPDSRWNNDYANRLQPGYVLDRDMQRMSRPAPSAMIRGLGRAPRGYRYIVIGGHVVLVDSGYRVHDTIRFELNFGR